MDRLRCGSVNWDEIQVTLLIWCKVQQILEEKISVLILLFVFLLRLHSCLYLLSVSRFLLSSVVLFAFTHLFCLCIYLCRWLHDVLGTSLDLCTNLCVLLKDLLCKSLSLALQLRSGVERRRMRTRRDLCVL